MAAIEFFEFESDVISDGTQTELDKKMAKTEFESDVISDGTQTGIFGSMFDGRLRVM